MAQVNYTQGIKRQLVNLQLSCQACWTSRTLLIEYEAVPTWTIIRIKSSQWRVANLSKLILPVPSFILSCQTLHTEHPHKIQKRFSINQMRRPREESISKKLLALASPLYSEKAMAPHSSTLAWKIPWMEEPGRLQSMGSLRVGHDWATSLLLFTFMHWRRKWQPTPVFSPGESETEEPSGLPSMGLRRVGHDWSNLAAAAASW